MTDIKVNYRRLQNSSVPTWLGLVIGSWFGLAWAGLLSAPAGIGFGITAATAVGGFIAVPLWGTVWGLIGLGKQRQSALRRHGITLLEADDPLAQRVYVLAAQLGLKTRPWVGVMPHNNAYAIGSGPDSALVVIGQPLIDTLDDAEVDAIIGHELGHIANNDMRRMGLARSFQNSLVWYLGFSNTLQRWARWLLTWLSEFLILSLSREREFWADAIGAALTSKEHMIAVLEKLHNSPPLGAFEREHARLMFRGIPGLLFSTHPTLRERRAALNSERYLKRIPIRRQQESLPLEPAVALPNVEDIAYAKR
ncbi:M48 family metalloprotease [Rhizobium sp. BR 314]|uniref:M48 family metalloprotease n=1 Tax=Rhizobium sp. BR 314 TaxID=3040013 RepID=UPI0039BF3076